VFNHPYYAGDPIIDSNEKVTDKKMVIQTILIEIIHQSCTITFTPLLGQG
jgi:hypothetical protein